jgi:hypothetical protein
MFGIFSIRGEAFEKERNFTTEAVGAGKTAARMEVMKLDHL